MRVAFKVDLHFVTTLTRTRIIRKQHLVNFNIRRMVDISFYLLVFAKRINFLNSTHILRVITQPGFVKFLRIYRRKITGVKLLLKNLKKYQLSI